MAYFYRYDAQKNQTTSKFNFKVLWDMAKAYTSGRLAIYSVNKQQAKLVLANSSFTKLAAEAHEELRTNGQKTTLAKAGFVAASLIDLVRRIASIPLFIVNMLYLSSLAAREKCFAEAQSNKLWYLPGTFALILESVFWLASHATRIITAIAKALLLIAMLPLFIIMAPSIVAAQRSGSTGNNSPLFTYLDLFIVYISGTNIPITLNAMRHWPRWVFTTTLVASIATLMTLQATGINALYNIHDFMKAEILGPIDKAFDWGALLSDSQFLGFIPLVDTSMVFTALLLTLGVATLLMNITMEARIMHYNHFTSKSAENAPLLSGNHNAYAAVTAVNYDNTYTRSRANSVVSTVDTDMGSDNGSAESLDISDDLVRSATASPTLDFVGGGGIPTTTSINAVRSKYITHDDGLSTDHDDNDSDNDDDSVHSAGIALTS